MFKYSVHCTWICTWSFVVVVSSGRSMKKTGLGIWVYKMSASAEKLQTCKENCEWDVDECSWTLCLGQSYRAVL